MDMNQALSSPTCSTISQSPTGNDCNELAAKLARRNMIAEGYILHFPPYLYFALL